MPYDELLAARVRPLMSHRWGNTEKKMFGGVGFMLDGNMCCGVWKKLLILRVGPDRYEETLSGVYVRVFDITGRAMRGWVMIEPEATASDEALTGWIELAVQFTRTLPKK